MNQLKSNHHQQPRLNELVIMSNPRNQAMLVPFRSKAWSPRVFPHLPRALIDYEQAKASFVQVVGENPSRNICQPMFPSRDYYEIAILTCFTIHHRRS